jgi:hypothetical protein
MVLLSIYNNICETSYEEGQEKRGRIEFIIQYNFFLFYFIGLSLLAIIFN